MQIKKFCVISNVTKKLFGKFCSKFRDFVSRCQLLFTTVFPDNQVVAFSSCISFYVFKMKFSQRNLIQSNGTMLFFTYP